MNGDQLDTFDEEFNPFQAPASAAKAQGLFEPFAPEPDPGDLEAIRRKHLNHEASLRAVGYLNYFTAVLGTIGGTAALAAGLGLWTPPDEQWGPAERNMVALGGAIALAIGIFCFLLGHGLSRLRPWARAAQGVFSVLAAVLNILNPIAALIHGYIAYLALSAKGKMVCSPEYRRVIEATPHIRYRTHWLVKALLAVLVLVLLLIAVGLALSSMQD